MASSRESFVPKERGYFKTPSMQGKWNPNPFAKVCSRDRVKSRFHVSVMPSTTRERKTPHELYLCPNVLHFRVNLLSRTKRKISKAMDWSTVFSFQLFARGFQESFLNIHDFATLSGRALMNPFRYFNECKPVLALTGWNKTCLSKRHFKLAQFSFPVENLRDCYQRQSLWSRYEEKEIFIFFLCLQ